MTKYNAERTTVDGIHFASKAEADHYGKLKILLRSGLIKNVEVHPKFLLFEKYNHPVTGRHVPGIFYIADFKVTHNDDSIEVVDVKSSATKTAVYKLKKKMFEYRYKTIITEVVY